jgi:hypothetical protein
VLSPLLLHVKNVLNGLLHIVVDGRFRRGGGAGQGVVSAPAKLPPVHLLLPHFRPLFRVVLPAVHAHELRRQKPRRAKVASGMSLSLGRTLQSQCESRNEWVRP